MQFGNMLTCISVGVFATATTTKDTLRHIIHKLKPALVSPAYTRTNCRSRLRHRAGSHFVFSFSSALFERLLLATFPFPFRIPPRLTGCQPNGWAVSCVARQCSGTHCKCFPTTFPPTLPTLSPLYLSSPHPGKPLSFIPTYHPTLPLNPGTVTFHLRHVCYSTCAN